MQENGCVWSHMQEIFSFYNKKLIHFVIWFFWFLNKSYYLKTVLLKKQKKYLKTGKLNSEASFLEDSGLYLSMDFGSSSLAFKLYWEQLFHVTSLFIVLNWLRKLVHSPFFVCWDLEYFNYCKLLVQIYHFYIFHSVVPLFLSGISLSLHLREFNQKQFSEK